ncbi:uncharacterized protein LOC106645693 [Copidosoma floridanum]|uniref:uncharacterized protein LOC106645693 n=1 Tax=Copidosoma floridanum TaxID=29053 RepID=UPI0006C9D40D|nr:uncharacterized protein LOC106645693 [Copidosoma floridanum]
MTEKLKNKTKKDNFTTINDKEQKLSQEPADNKLTYIRKEKNMEKEVKTTSTPLINKVAATQRKPKLAEHLGFQLAQNSKAVERAEKERERKAREAIEELAMAATPDGDKEGLERSEYKRGVKDQQRESRATEETNGNASPKNNNGNQEDDPDKQESQDNTEKNLEENSNEQYVNKREGENGEQGTWDTKSDKESKREKEREKADVERIIPPPKPPPPLNTNTN